MTNLRDLAYEYFRDIDEGGRQYHGTYKRCVADVMFGDDGLLAWAEKRLGDISVTCSDGDIPEGKYQDDDNLYPGMSYLRTANEVLNE